MELTLRLRPVRGPLGAANATRRWAERESLHLLLEDPAGARGEGEAAPLPGFSLDTLEDARAALGTLGSVTADPAEPLARVPTELPPAAAFALEIALLDWAGHRAATSVDRWLPPRHAALPLAALAAPGGGSERPDSPVKLKIGGDLDAELAHARTLRADGHRLRFDANGSLDRAALPRVLDALADLDAEMLEEPCAGPWPTSSPVPLAVDESLARDPAAALGRLERGEATRAVIKPMLFGGPTRVAAVVAEVEARGGGCVFSHVFGGPLERAAAGALALAHGMDAPMGLGAHAGLALWPPATLAGFTADSVFRHGEPGLGVRWERP
ncbi:MAG: hypothetical protein CMN30_04705 [Sandaracinus sp.]|nr:hypothetical protein [Sandaracinus sp.]